jgi:hypothetical protein
VDFTNLLFGPQQPVSLTALLSRLLAYKRPRAEKILVKSTLRVDRYTYFEILFLKMCI